MKNRFFRSLGWVGTIGLALSLGCSNQSAQQEQPHIARVSVVPAPSVEAEADTSPPIYYTAAPPTSALSPLPVVAPTPNAPPAPATAPSATAKVSPAAEEIIRMAQAGVSESVMMSYIENSPQPFSLNSDGIVYLNDLGVTANVVTAMIRRDAQLSVASPAATAPGLDPTMQNQMVSNLPDGTGQPQPEFAPPSPPTTEAVTIYQPETVYVTAPAEDEQVSYFYDSLAPYGSWMYVGGYGWCWQPTVVVSSGGWRPYCDAGRWYWSDSGWYWHSDYSWGWAPFHYGRWFQHGRAGWLWCPGNVWGPSWVSWRYTDGYCGWAPLPPAACWSVGVGFTYHGSAVAMGFEFGLTGRHYAWVPTQRFCDYNLRRHCEPVERAQVIYHNSTVINNYTVVNHNAFVNHGVGRDTIVRHVGSELRNVTVQERPLDRTGIIRPERLHKEGAGLVVDRPALPRNPPVASAAAHRSYGNPPSNLRNSSGSSSALTISQPAGQASRLPLRGSPSPSSALTSSGNPPASVTTSEARRGATPGLVISPATRPNTKPEVATRSETVAPPSLKAEDHSRQSRSDVATSVTPRTGRLTVTSSGNPNAPVTSPTPRTGGLTVKPANPAPPAKLNADPPNRGIIIRGPSNPTVGGQVAAPSSASKPNVSLTPRASVEPARPANVPVVDHSRTVTVPTRTEYSAPRTVPSPSPVYQPRVETAHPAPQVRQPIPEVRHSAPAPAPAAPSYTPAPSHSAPSPAPSAPSRSESRSSGGSGRTDRSK
jgi:hypothetical protein